MARCVPHHLEACPVCAEDDKILEDFPENVYMTTGWGGTFLKKKNCHALRHGQKLVKKRGGDPAPVVPIETKWAMAKGKEPCQVCFPLWLKR